MLILLSRPDEDKGKVARNTAEVFGELYEQHMPKVFRYISYRVADVDTAQDITSIVFEKALSKFTSFREEKAGFGTWILSIARNAVVDHYRAKGKEQEFRQSSMKNAPVQGESPDDELVHMEEVQKLKLCIAQLPQQEQEIIALKFGGEMTNRQIAKTLGLSDSNVGIIIYRAVRKLRDYFGVKE